MSSRKQNIEDVIDGMQAIKRRLFITRFSKFKNKKRDITHSQMLVLGIISKSKDINTTELAKMLGITNSAVTQLVDELVAKKYINRVEKSHDRRIFSLKLSKKSENKMKEIRARNLVWYTKVFSSFSDKELSQYAALNKKVSKNLLENKN